MIVIKLLVAAVTGIGGHYLNRRWDKAVFFICLFALVVVAEYALLIYLLEHHDGPLSEYLQQTTRILSYGMFAGVVLVWLLSLAVTYKDGRKFSPTTIAFWTPAGVVGALLTTCASTLFLLFVGTTFVTSLHVEAMPSVSSYNQDVEGRDLHNLYAHAYFGGSSGGFKLPEPPAGDGVLRGRISYQGAPVAGVRLTLEIDSMYRSAALVSDEQGLFTLPVTSGAHMLNAVQTSSWAGKPSGADFSLRHAFEAPLQDDSYDRYHAVARHGQRIEVQPGDDAVHLDLRLSEDLRLVWPDPLVEQSVATLSDTLRWEAYPEAVRYHVTISERQRDGDTTRILPMTSRVLDGTTQLALEQLPHMAHDGESHTYSVKVHAFDADGLLLAESTDRHEGGTFVLTEGQMLIAESDLPSLGEGVSAAADPEELRQRFEAHRRNRTLADAAELLIDEQEFPPAEILLAQIESEHAQGRKEALSGYLLALQGKCGLAEQLFKQAADVNEDICIPAEYRAGCE